MRGVNLLPPIVVKKRKLTRERRIVILWGGVIVVLILLGYLSLFISVQSYQRSIKEKERLLAAQENEWVEIQKSVARVKRIEEETATLEERVQTIEELMGGNFYYWEILRELGRIIPEKVWLREFNLDSQTNRLSVKGSAPSETLIAPFLAALDTSRYFREVELKETRKNEEEDYKDFELTCIPQGRERK